MSYIVKNCPAKYFAGATNMKCSELGGDCDTKTDCLLKSIIKLCNEARRTGRKAYLPIDILKLMEIEEV